MFICIMYVCVCVCVCVYSHTHTHTHTHISMHDIGGVDGGTRDQRDLVQQEKPPAQVKMYRQLISVFICMFSCCAHVEMHSHDTDVGIGYTREGERERRFRAAFEGKDIVGIIGIVGGTVRNREIGTG